MQGIAARSFNDERNHVKCLDAETLAAWMDGGLKGAALEDVQTHVAGCERCQMLLGAMGRTRGAVSPAEPRTVSRPWLAWAVPLTAAAAAIAVWVAVPQQRQTVPPPTTTPATAPAESPVEAVPVPQRKPESAPAPEARPAAPPRPTAPSSPDNFARQDATTLDKTAPPAAAAPPPPVRAEERGLIAGAVQQRVAAARDAATFCGPAAPSDVVGQLMASSAPSSDVCWVTGRAGLVMRSVEGRTWQRINFPERTDLTGVVATDSNTAVVTAADGRTFRTADGGVTWTQP